MRGLPSRYLCINLPINIRELKPSSLVNASKDGINLPINIRELKRAVSSRAKHASINLPINIRELKQIYIKEFF